MSKEKKIAKLRDKLESIQLNIRSPLVSNSLKESLKVQEEHMKMKIIEAAGQLRLF